MMKIRLLFILYLAALLSSCSLIEDPVRPCPVDEGRDDDVMLSFQLDASGSLTGSRADDHTNPTHPEVDSEWREFEEGIDFNDLGIFVFAQKAPLDGTGSEKLVFKTTDMKDDSVRIDGGPGAYFVDLTLNKSHLERIIGTKLTEDVNTKIAFRILILANSGMSDWSKVNGTTFKEVADILNELAFDMTSIYNPESQEQNVTDLYIGNIPMFGTNTFRVTKNVLYNSREDQKAYVGEIDLLRSLAKVRVVDCISNKTEKGYPKISAVTFYGSQYLSRPLPYNALTYENGTQVHKPNIAEEGPLYYDETDIKGNYRLGILPENWVEANIKGPGGVEINGVSTWVGFVPEQEIGLVNNTEGTGCPMLRITIANHKNSDGTEDTTDYSVRMNNFVYAGGFGDAILRNHIYTLLVDLDRHEISATVDLVPYIGVNLDPVFGKDRPSK